MLNKTLTKIYSISKIKHHDGQVSFLFYDTKISPFPSYMNINLKVFWSRVNGHIFVVIKKYIFTFHQWLLIWRNEGLYMTCIFYIFNDKGIFSKLFHISLRLKKIECKEDQSPYTYVVL